MGGRTFRTAVTLLIAVAMPACGNGDDDADEPTMDSVYVAVLRHLDLPPGADDEPAIVYVVDGDGDPLSLDDQVAVIQELEDVYDVRFFDEIEAVTDIDDEGSLVPPLDGPLVAVGAPTADDDRLTVRTEVVVTDEDAIAWLLTLDGAEGTLRVVASNQIQPELLVDPATT